MNSSVPKNFLQGVEPTYLMPLPQAENVAPDVPHGEEMAKIVRIGARTVEWLDRLQENIPFEKREQIWRKQDGVGKEPTPDKPSRYNPDSILRKFTDAIKMLPESVSEIVQAETPLPPELPDEHTVHEVIPGFRQLSKAYMNASRWLALYPIRGYLNKEARDFRPWLYINATEGDLLRVVQEWKDSSPERRSQLLGYLVDACPMAKYSSAEDCAREAEPLLKTDDNQAVGNWFKEIYDKGKIQYDSRFQVVKKHPGITVDLSHPSVFAIHYSSFGVPAEILSWISGLVAEGWNSTSFTQTIGDDAMNTLGTIKVLWEKDALPHVNGPGGDTITMDANQKTWLEITQVTMIHEFGHVMGFPDCYVEFWEEGEGAFTFYSLDPTDRMCALTGETFEHHREAMRTAYRPTQ